MPKNNSNQDQGNIRIIVLSAVAVVIAVVLAFVYWTPSSPQMGSDAEVFKTVDALFTAVSSKDEGRLAQCEQKLQALRQDGKLPAKAADTLAGVIQEARSGGWRQATEKTYSFMKGQRR